MRAAGVLRFGGPEQLKLLEVEPRDPIAGEVRVRLRAAGINPADVLFREGRLAIAGDPSPPFVPGMDGSGAVDAVGPGVPGTIVGQNVMVLCVPARSGRGTYAESVVVPAASVVPLPAGVDHFVGATFLLNALTADLALTALGLSPGGRLLVSGASGGVGGFAVQLAKAAGLEVATTANTPDRQTIEELGADHIFPREGDLAKHVQEIWSGGADGAVDAAVLGERLLPALRHSARVAAVRDFAGTPDRGIQIHRITYAANATDSIRLARIGQLIDRGDLTSRVLDTYPLARAALAQERLSAGRLRGRLVLDTTA